MTIVFSKLTGPAGKVIVFEPNEDNNSKILEHIRLNQAENVKVMKYGVGDEKNDMQNFYC